MNSYISVLKKYSQFDGRASRREYWRFTLINTIIMVALPLISYHLIHAYAAIATMVYHLAVLLPGIAVLVRRLHDTGRSGYWLFIAFIPAVGTLILLVFLLLAGQPEHNRFGPIST